MIGHRTTARGILFLIPVIAAALAAATAAGRTPPRATAGATTGVPEILFPVLGKVQYTDDFGDPRGDRSHAGNDIMVARRSPVIAVEDGTVEWWTSSAPAGCMLYLEGRSGTRYLYIHLNNDRTLGNDNAGGCVAGRTYAVADGARVLGGQQIAWSGDSGDADGNPHLHFEIHPGGGEAVSPFAALTAARRPLFPARLGAKAAVGLRGTVVGSAAARVDVSVTSVRWWPGGRWVEVEPRVVELALDAATVVHGVLPARHDGSAGDAHVTVVSRAARATTERTGGQPGALVAAHIRPRA